MKSVLDFGPDCARVLDADAIVSKLSGLDENCILTPHQGEFERAFGRLEGSRSEQAQAAARLSGALVVLKGAETIIAHPDGRFAINTHASPWLAKAGTGDVLAGMIAGLLAQGMPSFESALAAVWIHGEAGIEIGPGLIAGDIPEAIPGILRKLLD